MTVRSQNDQYATRKLAESMKLRCRKDGAICKPPKLIVKSVRPPTLQTLIESSWRTCKTENKNQPLQIDDIVMGKMFKFCTWPGTIIEFTKDKKRAKILFFGTHNICSVNISEIVPFSAAHKVIRLILLRNPNDFSKGILEAERVLGIDENLSITKQQNAIP